MLSIRSHVMVRSSKPTPYSELIKRITPTDRFRIISLDPYVAEGRLALPYRYFPGEVVGRFLIGLRDERKLLAIRCRSCGTVYCPPEPICGKCLMRAGEWLEVGPQGTLESFTQTNYSLDIHPLTAPILYGLVKLDGADTSMIHILGEVRLEDLKVGMRMEPLFREEPRGDILDIMYFRPVDRRKSGRRPARRDDEGDTGGPQG
jgi:hypothetical protein